MLIFGLPGHVDDGRWWVRLLSSLDRGTATLIALLAIGVMLLIVAPITWFSEQWHAPVVNWWRRIRHHAPLTAMPVLHQPDEDLARFRACLPHVERCRELIGPYASPLGGVNMGLEYLHTRGNTIIELIRELGYLTKSLNALGIRCPIVYGGNDESDSDFRVRLRIWNMHLVDLAVMIRHDDLAGARILQPIRQPTSDK